MENEGEEDTINESIPESVQALDDRLMQEVADDCEDMYGVFQISHLKISMLNKLR